MPEVNQTSDVKNSTETTTESSIFTKIADFLSITIILRRIH